jgi:hypothetical protein
MVIKKLASVALLLALAAPTQGQTVDDGRRLSWRVSVRGGDSTDTPRAYRLYDAGEEFQLRLAVTNEFDSPLFVDQQTLQQSLGLELSSARATGVGITVTWLPFVRFSGEHYRDTVDVPLDERVRVEAGRAVTWTIAIRRQDGAPFETAEYKLGVAIKGAAPIFRDDQGALWAGRLSLEQTDLTVVLAGPSSTYEQRREAYAAGRLATEEGKFEAAVNAYRGALAIESTDDTARSFLASAHVSLGQYRDAVPLLEQLRARAAGPNRIRAAQALALAHIAIGDEPSAIRVLQSEGFSGQELASELADFRARLRNRP